MVGHAHQYIEYLVGNINLEDMTEKCDVGQCISNIRYINLYWGKGFTSLSPDGMHT